jgi:hypothetical protein
MLGLGAFAPSAERGGAAGQQASGCDGAKRGPCSGYLRSGGASRAPLTLVSTGPHLKGHWAELLTQHAEST